MTSYTDEHALRPLTRRSHETPSTPAASSRSSSPLARAQNLATHSPSLRPGSSSTNDELGGPPSRSRSVLNLTASALSGIYNRAGFERDDAPTEPGTPLLGSARKRDRDADRGLEIDEGMFRDKSRFQTSQRANGHAARLDTETVRRTSSAGAVRLERVAHAPHMSWAKALTKSGLLAVVGLFYGLLISHLHDRQHMAPVPVQGLRHDTWGYLGFWGAASVGMGWALRWVDGLFDSLNDEEAVEESDGTATAARRASCGDSKRRDSGSGRRSSTWSPVWNDVVRSVGAFIGIAFAIRKLPWQSTLQLSLTLSMVNPAIWYLLDRTTAGFVFSTVIALVGTAGCLIVNPDVVPSPQQSQSRPGLASSLAPSVVGVVANASRSTGHKGQADLVAGHLSQESIGVATWIASVLFVSAVCFGNIGRRLW